MTTSRLSGVIAAVATAIDSRGEPDTERSTALGRFLLERGCDGLNVLGTTGEATSFSRQQRQRVMTAYADAGLPMHRLLVGAGAAALADAVALTRHAADLGFALAQNNLGVLYEQGRGLAKDDAQAVVWFRKAADQGLALGSGSLARASRTSPRGR